MRSRNSASAGGVAQLHAGQRCAAAEEMHVGVIEAGHHELAGQVDDVGARPGPFADFAAVPTATMRPPAQATASA